MTHEDHIKAHEEVLLEMELLRVTEMIKSAPNRESLRKVLTDYVSGQESLVEQIVYKYFPITPLEKLL